MKEEIIKEYKEKYYQYDSNPGDLENIYDAGKLIILVKFADNPQITIDMLQSPEDSVLALWMRQYMSMQVPVDHWHIRKPYLSGGQSYNYGGGPEETNGEKVAKYKIDLEEWESNVARCEKRCAEGMVHLMILLDEYYTKTMGVPDSDAK